MSEVLTYGRAGVEIRTGRVALGCVLLAGFAAVKVIEYMVQERGLLGVPSVRYFVTHVSVPYVVEGVLLFLGWNLVALGKKHHYKQSRASGAAEWLCMIPLMISLLFIFDSAYQYPKGAAMIHAAKAMSVSDATRAGIEAMWEEGLGRLMRASLQDRGVLALQTILLVWGWL